MSRTDPRTYITVHDGLPDHPKIVGLTDGAFRVLIMGWCWCSRYLTDGRMPVEVWEKLGTKRSREQLTRGPVSEALVVVSDDGKFVDFHDYLEHQRSREKVLDLRAKRSAAGSKGGRASSKTQANASHLVHDLVSKTQAENREQRTETELPTSVSSESYLSSAPERARPTRIPDPFDITGVMRRWAAENTPGLDIDWHTQSFIDFWRGKSGANATKLDWIATWRNWMRAEHGKPHARRTNGHGPPSRHEENAAVVERMRQHEAEQQNPFLQIEAR